MTSTPEAGPLAEEAARFVDALGDWARAHLGPAAGSIGQSAECAICPVCQLLSLVRQARPETFAHLLDASAALSAALRSVVEGHAAHGSSGAFERINLDDDADFV